MSDTAQDMRGKVRKSRAQIQNKIALIELTPEDECRKGYIRGLEFALRVIELQFPDIT